MAPALTGTGGMGGGATRAARSAAQRRRLTIVLCMTGSVLVVEVIGGLVSGSLALLADAGHMLTDVAGIGLAVLAMRFALRQADEDRTFGYYRLEILAAVVNGVLLFGIAAFVLIEAVRRLSDPPEIQSGLMLGVALLGAAANAVSVKILHPSQGESLNVRGAYLEALGDLLGSIGVLGAAVIVRTTGVEAADALASIVIGLLILPRTWNLLRESVDVLLEASPKGMDLSEVRRHILETDGVLDVHDLHAWTITSGMPVLSAHVVLAEDARDGDVLDLLAACLAEDFDVEHCTFQLETSDRRPIEKGGHR
jgi:cobalt-zinc-cadmium efflux system protein